MHCTVQCQCSEMQWSAVQRNPMQSVLLLANGAALQSAHKRGAHSTQAQQH